MLVMRVDKVPVEVMCELSWPGMAPEVSRESEEAVEQLQSVRRAG